MCPVQGGKKQKKKSETPNESGGIRDHSPRVHDFLSDDWQEEQKNERQ
jgi:hypothetical protein